MKERWRKNKYLSLTLAKAEGIWIVQEKLFRNNFLLVVIVFSFFILSCNKSSTNSSDLTTSLQLKNDSISLIKTTKPVFKSMPNEIHAPGYIDYDTRNANVIASRFSGRIEKLYVKYEYQHIQKGDKLFEIYSPEIVTAQENLIYLLNHDAQAKDLIQSTKQKLLLLGLTEEEINLIEKNNAVQRNVTVYSLYTGHVHAMAMDDQNEIFKEGMYVQKGQAIFNVLNPQQVWAVINIYPDDASKIKEGQNVDLSFSDFPGMIMKGEINFIQPYYQNGINLMRARVYLHNEEHHMHVGLLLNANIQAESDSGMWIPQTAVLDLGMNKVVWLKQGNSFLAHKIETGNSISGLTKIISGLSINDEIAWDSHYISDSESFVNTPLTLPKGEK